MYACLSFVCLGDIFCNQGYMPLNVYIFTFILLFILIILWIEGILCICMYVCVCVLIYTLRYDLYVECSVNMNSHYVVFHSHDIDFRGSCSR